MPSVTENIAGWATYEWPERGDEWSNAWGGTRALWFSTILPRIQAFVPAGRIVEIAPGFGRCTDYLKDLCADLVAVDVTARCVEACRQRFSASPHVRVFRNDGRSLAMVEDGSVDFVFSWDSLVHAEADVLHAYLTELGRKLRPGGVGFIHHSNLGTYVDPDRRALTVENRGWRATSMTAELFRSFCAGSGLHCASQEVIGWAGEVLSDCLSVFSRDEAALRAGTETKVAVDARFMEEAARAKSRAALYQPVPREAPPAGSSPGLRLSRRR